MSLTVCLIQTWLTLCGGKVSELQVQKVPLNILSKLETCTPPTCTGTGTLEHMLEIKILLPSPAETWPTKIFRTWCMLQSSEPFLPLWGTLSQRTTNIVQLYCLNQKLEPILMKCLIFHVYIQQWLEQFWTVGAVSLHSVFERMQVINPRCTHVSKVMICLSAFPLHVGSCLGNKSVFDSCWLQNLYRFTWVELGDF